MLEPRISVSPATDRPAEFPQAPRWLPRLLPAALTALLVACGGGGDSGGAAPASVAGPPSTGAVLANSSNEAAKSAVVAGADAAVAQAGALSGFSAVFGTPIAAHQSPAATRKRALAVIASTCDDWVDLPCSGSATVDTNVPRTATVVNAGDYLDVRFTSVSGLLLGNSVLLNGRMRMDFQSAFDPLMTQFPGLNLLLTLDGFSGSVNGKLFGPVTDLAKLQIDSQGAGTLTAAGARYTGLRGVTTTGPGDYTIAAATVRTSYWADAGRYVDLSLANWHVAGARPAVGSQATVSAAQGSMVITVAASTTASVVYTVSISSPTGNASFLVTATYPLGGGAPVYTAVPA
jgi:hypothetical protein